MGNSKFENRYFKLQQSFEHFVVKLSVIYSRFVAHQLRRKVIKKKGHKILTRKLKRTIKEYAKKRFGKKAYWPYLALYTEIRGKYIEGWIPHDYFRYVIEPRINPQSSCEISEHKTFDYRIFGDFALEPLFVFISGMFLNSDFEVVEKEQVKTFLSEYNDTIVLKEEKGTFGKQVRVLHSSEFKIEDIIPGLNYIIQPFVKQYKPLNDLYPDSVNTLRVTTYLNRDGLVDMRFVVLRFGNDGSKVDNVSSGGQCISLDSDGKPSNRAYNLMGVDMGDRHKNTGYRFADVSIPMFQEVVEACKSAHKKYPYVRLIGWDVCINDAGKPKLLEWNADDPGFWYWEDLFGPFFPDDDILLN